MSDPQSPTPEPEPGPRRRRLSLDLDDQGRLRAVAPFVGLDTRYAYDDDARTIVRTDPDGRSIAWQFDPEPLPFLLPDPATGRLERRPGDPRLRLDNACLRLRCLVDARGGQTTYAHDPDARLIHVADPDGRVTRFPLVPGYRLMPVLDPRTGLVTGHRYEPIRPPADPDDLLTALHDPRPLPSTIDLSALLECRSDPDRHRTTYLYGPGRPDVPTDPGGRLVTYTYDSRTYRFLDLDPGPYRDADPGPPPPPE
jgi:YD repeat-containing protein